MSTNEYVAQYGKPGMFTVRCDPPYEDDDGLPSETLVTVPAHELRSAILSAVAAVADRLLVDQAPAILEVRRLS
jgi:hypothetical protein